MNVQALESPRSKEVRAETVTLLRELADALERQEQPVLLAVVAQVDEATHYQAFLHNLAEARSVIALLDELKTDLLLDVLDAVRGHELEEP